MSKSNAEQERAYYNKKLIKESLPAEMKNQLSRKSFFRDFAVFFIGGLIGRFVIDLIGAETLFFNKTLRLVIEVLIIAAAITAVKAVFDGTGRLIHKNDA